MSGDKDFTPIIFEDILDYNSEETKKFLYELGEKIYETLGIPQEVIDDASSSSE